MAKRNWLRVGTGLAFLVLPLLFSVTLNHPPVVWGQGAGKVKEGAKGDSAREADLAAIRKATTSFIQAFENGDAKALAAHWTPEGEFVTDDGETIHGRAALEKSYAEFFKKHPKSRVEVDVESVRFVSRDTAIEEGILKVQKGKEHTSGRYSVLHVREEGNWLMAVVREWPSEGDSLRDLEWLIGTWSAKREDTEVRTTYEWELNKNFMRAHFTIKKGDTTTTGFQIIGKDPSLGVLRSWTFDSEGGIGDAQWNRDGKKWVLDAKAVMADGKIMSVDNVIIPLDNNSFSWQSINRSIDDEELPDIAPIKVTRVK